MKEDGATAPLRRGVGQLVFPAPCCLCEGPLADPLASPACSACRAQLAVFEDPACPKCGTFFAPGVAVGLCGECRQRRRPFRLGVSAAPYSGVFESAIIELKFRRREVLAELLAQPAAEAFRRAPRESDVDCDRTTAPGTGGPPPAAVVPVPLPFWRGRRRGFNQAELLARPIARELGIPLARGVLRKRRRPAQTTLSPRARRANMRGAFRVRRLPSDLVGRPLLLVDDVFTTGSTVEAAVRCLVRAGSGPVDVLTIARTV